MSKILTQRHGHVLAIGLNRAEKRNAFDPEMYRLLALAYGELDRDPELRCGLLYAVGDHFTAGLELPLWAAEIREGRFSSAPEGGIEPFGLQPDRRLGKPLVVALQGICFTVAIELALAADIRICAEGARFGQIEVRRGILAAGGATVRMVQEFGWGNAQRWLLTGDEFGAQEALRIGLVQEVVPAGRQYERALELAQRVASRAPLAVQASLRASRAAVLPAERSALAPLLQELRALQESEDAAEGVRSFQERREGQFKGK